MSGSIDLPIISKFDPNGIKRAQSALGSFKSSVGKLGAIVAGAFSVAAISNFVKSTVRAASDLEETAAAVNEVFGEAAAGLEKIAETAPQALGQTRQQFLDAAKQFGIFGQAAGLASEENAKFSAELVRLATDLASFNNTSVDDAIMALGAGLRGESEPLRRYGVLLDDATLKARAMEMGIYDGNGALALQQKVLAAQSEILAQTTTQQGDFARTSDGLANSQRILSATFEDMKATVGAALLPAFTALAQAMVPIVNQLAPMLTEIFEQLAPAFMELAGIIPQLLQAFMPLLPIIGQIASLFADVLIMVLPVFVSLIESLVPLIQMMVDTFAPFIEAILPILVQMLTSVIEVLMPLIEQILPIFLTLFEALAPVVLALIEAFWPLLETLLPLLTLLLETIVLPALQLFADMLAITLPAAFQMLQELGFLPNAAATEEWANKISDFVFNLRVFFVRTFNGIIEAVEVGTNALIRSINSVIRAAKAMPGVVGAMFRNVSEMQEIALARLAEPVREAAMTGLIDAGTNVGIFGDSIFRRGQQTGVFGDQTGAGSVGSNVGVFGSTGARLGSYINRIGERVYYNVPGQIPAFAEGGIVTGPTLGLIGEAGPEAVIPLSRAGKMGATYNITVNAGVGDPVRIGQDVVNAIRRYERVSGPVFARA